MILGDVWQPPEAYAADQSGFFSVQIKEKFRWQDNGTACLFREYITSF
jgi:hypothetical protein